MTGSALPSDLSQLAECAGWAFDRSRIAALVGPWLAIEAMPTSTDDEVRAMDTAARELRATQAAAVWASVEGPARERLLERFVEGTSRPHRWSSSAGPVGTGYAERSLYALTGANPAAAGLIHDEG